MAVKDEQEEADVMNMVELLPSPHDQLLARLDLSTHLQPGHVLQTGAGPAGHVPQ